MTAAGTRRENNRRDKRRRLSGRMAAMLMAALAFACCELVHLRCHVGSHLTTMALQAQAAASGHVCLHTAVDEADGGADSCPICHGTLAAATAGQVLPQYICAHDAVVPRKVFSLIYRFEAKIFVRGPPAGRC